MSLIFKQSKVSFTMLYDIVVHVDEKLICYDYTAIITLCITSVDLSLYCNKQSVQRPIDTKIGNQVIF